MGQEPTSQEADLLAGLLANVHVQAFANFRLHLFSISCVFRKFFECLGRALTCWDLLGSARMHSDASGCVRIRPDAFGKFDPKNSFCNFPCVLEDLGLPPLVFRGPGDLIL